MPREPVTMDAAHLSEGDYYSTKRVHAAPDDMHMALTYQDGYQSKCPMPTFVRDYQPVTAMDFGHALHAMKSGANVRRASWRGNVPLTYIQVTRMGFRAVTIDGGAVMVDDAYEVPEHDILAEDWQIFEDAQV